MICQTVYTFSGESQVLGAEVGCGGEGSVHALQSRPEILVKTYHESRLKQDGAALQAKLQAMAGLASLRDQVGLSWPLLLVYGPKQNWLGYAMRRQQGKSLKLLAHKLVSRVHFPGVTRVQMVQVMLNICQQVKQLRAAGVMIGDYNMANFLVDPHTYSVSLIDCDSYQVTIQGKRYPCVVGTPEMTPAEHHGQDFASLVRTAESEDFSLAILLFMCLMLGRHPYDVIGGDSQVDNLRNGKFPYGIGNTGIPRGHWYNIWSHMPHSLKSAFIQTFTEGSQTPARRITLDQWIELLVRYQKEMGKGWHNTELVPVQPKSKVRQGQGSTP